MAFEQIINFLSKLESSPLLLEEVGPMNLNDILLLARREGFEISNRDWKEYIQENIRQASTQLSDSELEQVVGAGAPVDPNLTNMCTSPPITCLIGC